MTDYLTVAERSEAMRRVKSKDGPLEVAVRSALWRRGHRFRKHVKALPGRPDIVFTKSKVAVFIDGDFWHGYNFAQTRDKLTPYWREKIQTNIDRDEANFAKLRNDGWQVVRLWGHEIKANLEDCIQRIEATVAN